MSDGRDARDVLFWKRGQTEREPWQWFEADGVTPIPLTGYTARMQVKERAGDDEPALLTLTSPSGGLTITAATGIVEAAVTHSQTAAFAVGSYVFDLLLISPGGDRTFLVEGTVTVRERTTEES